MPTGFDHFTSYADRDYSDCSPEAAANAQLLERTMEKHGFVPYFAEWWHFEDAVEYPVDEYFDAVRKLNRHYWDKVSFFSSKGRVDLRVIPLFSF